MQLEKGLWIRVNGYENLEDFAKGILALINAKSQYNNVIHDVRTYHNSNDVDVIAYKDSDFDVEKFVKHYLGNIEFVKEMEFVIVAGSDLQKEVSSKIEKLEDEYYDNDGNEVEVIFDSNF